MRYSEPTPTSRGVRNMLSKLEFDGFNIDYVFSTSVF